MSIKESFREGLAHFTGAVQFLTVLPMRSSRIVGSDQAAIYFPFVGALLGAAAGGLLLFCRVNLGEQIASLLAISGLAIVTGGLHEDGLADVADSCRAGRSRETILRIMKDSRIGVYGALALVISVLIRWQALSRCRMSPVLGLAAAVSLSRTSLVCLASWSPPVGEGLGATFVREQTRTNFYVALALSLLVACVCAQWNGLAMACATGATVLGARAYFIKRIGGVTGDCLGATCQVSEMVNLLILAWQPSI